MSDKTLRSRIIRLAHARPELRSDLLPLLTKRAGRGRTLDRGTRQRVNKDLTRVGLDGNGRFRKPGLGVSAAWPVLSKYGIEPGEILHADRFRQPSGQFSIDIAFSNPEDSFSPEQISNSMLVIQYTELRDSVYEVLAYLS